MDECSQMEDKCVHREKNICEFILLQIAFKVLNFKFFEITNLSFQSELGSCGLKLCALIILICNSIRF